jgi:hypothetical protein
MIIMTYLNFKRLALESQATVLCTTGALLAERELSQYEITLYQVEGFYVEVFYHKKEKLTSFKSFTDLRLLNPYLKRIDLSGLF